MNPFDVNLHINESLAVELAALRENCSLFHEKHSDSALCLILISFGINYLRDSYMRYGYEFS